MPDSISTTFEGAALAFRNNLSNELLLLLAAVLVMYIVLGVLYESFIHPVTILSTLPSAGIGALLALIVFGDDLTIIALIGIILLIGIVKKNAILMIDFAIDAERNQGMAPREAIYQACLLRFRPILMTTVAAIFGALPLMFGTGTGSELRHPLGVTIVGGLLVSQVLTLFTTPVIYLAFDRIAKRIARQVRGGRGARAIGGPADVNISAPFIARPVATILLDHRRGAGGRRRVQSAARCAVAENRRAGHIRVGQSAGRQPRSDGRDRGHAAGTAPRRHRRCG